MIEPERVDYDLKDNDLVWDIGAYRGDFSAAILARFRGIRVMAFEPMTIYVDSLNKRLRMLSDHAKVFPFGLEGADKEASIPLDGDRTSLYHAHAIRAEESGGPPMPARFVDVVAFMDQHQVTRVDLAKINIEGGEFALLDRILTGGRIQAFRHLQVQFHDFMPGALELYDSLVLRLGETHRRQWCRPWVWESWEAK